MKESLKKRSVFNNSEVVKSQPQQKEEKIIEPKIKPKIENVEEEKEKVVHSEKKKKVTQISNVDNNIIEVGDKRFRNREGYYLYTIGANIKIGDDKFFIQRVVQEKNERLANTEYDRVIKKEFGKPKSVTKRAIRQYVDGDTETMKAIADEQKVIEKTSEQLEFERKLELLDSEYVGFYKVIFKNNIPFNVKKDYVLASDTDDVYVQLDMIEEEQNGDKNKHCISSCVKQIIRMTQAAIKTDKDCLKSVAKISLEDLEKLVEDEKKDEERDLKNGVEIYKQLREKGFKLYHTENKSIKLTELARTRKEVAMLIATEYRIKISNKIEDLLEEMIVATVNEEETMEEAKKKFGIDDGALALVKAIRKTSNRKDWIYSMLFKGMTIDECINLAENVLSLKPKFIKDIEIKEIED